MKRYLHYILLLASTLLGCIVVSGRIGIYIDAATDRMWDVWHFLDRNGLDQFKDIGLLWFLEELVNVSITIVLVVVVVTGIRTVSCWIRFRQLPHGASRYAFALCLNIVAMCVAGNLAMGVVTFFTGNIVPWIEVYQFVAEWMGSTRYANDDYALIAALLLKFALSCGLASPGVWMLTRRFSISAL